MKSMKSLEQDKKDLRKLFVNIRVQLEAKEKELIELQRKESSLLPPDDEQMSILLDNIASLHLSSEDGSFVFSPDPIRVDFCSSTSVCSTGIDLIRNVPLSLWLCPSISKSSKEENRLSMFNHILSLPVHIYLVSSREKRSCLPLINPVLTLPLHTFKTSRSIGINSKKETLTEFPLKERTPNSIFDTEKIYSKEYWITNNQMNSQCL